MGLSAREQQELAEYRAAKKAEADKGRLDKRAVELGDEILRPIGLRVNSDGPSGLTDVSRTNFHEQLRRVVESGQENALYERQQGWRKGE